MLSEVIVPLDNRLPTVPSGRKFDRKRMPAISPAIPITT